MPYVRQTLLETNVGSYLAISFPHSLTRTLSMSAPNVVHIDFANHAEGSDFDGLEDLDDSDDLDTFFDAE